MCSVRMHTRADEQNATLPTICLRMSSSQPLTVSGMYGFCRWAAALWAICWSLCVRWLGLRNRTRSGGQHTFAWAVGRGLTVAVRLARWLGAYMAHRLGREGERRRDGPAGAAEWWCAPSFVSCWGCFGAAPLWEAALSPNVRLQRCADLTIFKRLGRVAA
jgi:hypothetical protein